jgi:hypothetical protein
MPATVLSPVLGKCGKVRFVPVHVTVPQLIEQYLALADRAADTSDPVPSSD